MIQYPGSSLCDFHTVEAAVLAMKTEVKINQAVK